MKTINLEYVNDILQVATETGLKEYEPDFYIKFSNVRMTLNMSIKRFA